MADRRKWRVVYEPAGRAREYAALATNIWCKCNNGCLYCYVPQVLRMANRKSDYHQEPTQPRIKNFLKQFELDCMDLLEAFDSVPPIQLGFLDDPYPAIEEELQIVRSIIMIAKAYSIPIQILTKRAALATRDLDLLTYSDKNVVGVTLTTMNDEKAKYWEPNADSMAARVLYLQQAHEAKITTEVSFEPVLFPDEVLSMAGMLNPIVDKFKIGKLNTRYGDSEELIALEKSIDWNAFGLRAEETMSALGRHPYVEGGSYKKTYMLKDDLLAKMGRPTIWK